MLEPIASGIALGLLLGKPIGIMGACFLAVKLGFASLPTGIQWHHMLGVALLAGIGFTMSLFIGNLAFDTPDQAASVRIGVLSGSIIAAIAGYTLLRATNKTSD